MRKKTVKKRIKHIKQFVLVLLIIIISMFTSCSSDDDATKNCELIECRKLYAPTLDVYVARGDNQFGSNVSVEHIYEMITGLGARSVNPILLQFDVIFLRENVAVHNVVVKTERTISEFANERVFLFGTRLSESDANGRLTDTIIEVAPEQHHLLLYKSENRAAGYTGGGKSGIICNVFGCTRNVLAHEFGHMFGLLHTSAEGNNLMNPVIFDNDVDISAAERDITARYIQNNYIEINSASFGGRELSENLKKRLRIRMKEAYVGPVRIEPNQISKEEYSNALSLIPENKEFHNTNATLNDY